MDRTEMMNCLAVIERTFYGQRSGITAARAIAHIEALEAENAALNDDNMMLKMTCNGLQKLVAKEQEEGREDGADELRNLLEIAFQRWMNELEKDNAG
jgi:hypothetical protein